RSLTRDRRRRGRGEARCDRAPRAEHEPERDPDNTATENGPTAADRQPETSHDERSHESERQRRRDGDERGGGDAGGKAAAPERAGHAECSVEADEGCVP